MVLRCARASRARELRYYQTVDISGMYSSLEEALENLLLVLVRRRTQNLTKIDQERAKIKQIYLLTPLTSALIM